MNRYLDTTRLRTIIADGHQLARETVLDLLTRVEQYQDKELQQVATQITTLAQLEQLPAGAVILDKHGDTGMAEHGRIKFAETASLSMEYVAKHFLPATVIHNPRSLQERQ